jgi:acetylornithine deacetylase/succinyl-diaminopimelate desuccinylase-like protein
VYLARGGRHWLGNPNNSNFQAAARATERVYGVKPDMIREGGSIPITLTIQEVSEKDVILLPLGAADDGAHSQNEKIDVANYINGVRYLSVLKKFSSSCLFNFHEFVLFSHERSLFSIIFCREQ